jgi:protein TonB
MLAKPRALARHWSNRIDARLDAVAALPPPPVFLTVEKALAVSVPMQSATCVSFALHILLIIGVGIAGIDPSKFAPPHNVMDVVLVNSRSATKPLKADALGQTNLDGGGNTDEKRRAKTPLPAIEQQAAKNARQAQDRVKELEQEMKTLMTQAKATAKVLQGEINQTPSGTPDPLSATDLMQKSIEIARLEAQISREYDAYQQRPKRTFVGARVSEYRFAQYVDNWRLKIERIGNLNYPQEAKSRQIHANVQVTVAIKANGEVEGIEIHTARAPKVLRDAVMRIVRLSAPFDRFPDNIKRDTDVLHITRTWIFTQGDKLTSE